MLFGCSFFLFFEAIHFSFISSWLRRLELILDARVPSSATLISAYCSAGWSRPSFINGSLNHVACLYAKFSATYSAFVDDKIMEVWCFEHQLTGPPLSMKINSDLDFLVT